MKSKIHSGFFTLFTLQVICFLVGVAAQSLQAQTIITGPITTSQTWPMNVVLSGDVTIKDNGIVTILPGTVIKAAANSDDQAGGSASARVELIVEGGKLLILGTPASPVVFSSSSTDGAAGDWYGIRFKYGTMTMKSATIEFGRRGLSLEGGGELTISDSTYRKCSEDGVRVTAPSLYELADCTFINNTGWGVNAADSGSRLTLANALVSGNSAGGLNLQDNSTLTNCQITQNGGPGCSLGSSSTLTDCAVSGNGGLGIGCVSGLALTRVLVDNNMGYGIAYSSGSGAVRITGGSVSNNRSGNGSGYGIYIYYSGDVVVQGTLIERNAYQGVYSYYGGRFENCTIQFNGHAGISTSGSDTANPLTVAGSTIVNNSQQGVFAQSSVTVQNSTISNNKGGVDAAQVSVTGTTLGANAEYGVRIRNGNNTPLLAGGISGNVIKANGAGIKLESNASSISLSGNDLVDNGLAVENRGTGSVIANGNYWGDTTTAELQSGVLNLSKIFDSRDDRGVGNVHIANFLTGSFQDPATQTENYTRPPFPGATKTVSGIISGAQTWSGTVFLTGDVTIPTGSTLTVLPGTRVLSDWVADDTGGNFIELIVDGGRLTVVGTSTAPVVFTSAATNPTPADWYGIRFHSGTMTLSFATIEYGFNGLSLDGGGELAISNSTFRKSRYHGVYVPGASLYELLNCAFVNNTGWGLYAESGSRITLANALVSGNSAGGLNLQDNSTLTNCQITQNGGPGCNLANSSTLTDCAVTGNGGLGIGCVSGLTLTRVQVDNNMGYGISYSSGSGAVRITGGSVSNNRSGNGSGYGIYIYYSGDVVVQGTLIERNAYQGVYSYNGGRFENCTIQFNGNAGISTSGSDTANPLSVAGSTIVNNSQQGVFAQSSVTVQNSTISNNKGGVDVVQVSLTGSALAGNAEFGLRIRNGNNTPVTAGGITNNLFRANGAGIKLESNASEISFSGNDLVENGLAVEDKGTANVTANGNYWGAQTTAELQNNVVNLTKIFDRRDDPNVGLVTIAEYSTAAFNSAPTITTQPQSAEAPADSTATLTVAASGKEPLTYQWQLNGVDLVDNARIQGSQTNKLVIAAVEDADGGVLFVTIKNSFGQVVSDPVIFTVTASLLQINQQPSNVFVTVGGNATFSVAATGITPFSYQWRKGEEDILGANGATYDITGVQTDQAGTYKVVVSNAAGSVISSGAILTVNPLSTGNHHAADYRDARFVIDGSEISRVLSYWRTGAYHPDLSGFDGYAAGTGSTTGTRHTADYQDAAWIIDGSEANRVLSYWRSGAYHADASGLDGFAAGAGVMPAPSSLKSSRPLTEPTVKANHQAAATYKPGGLLEVSVDLSYTKTPLALLLRPILPARWKLKSARGDGSPEVGQGEILWTGDIPGSPMKIVYTVEVPDDESGTRAISAGLEWYPAGQSNLRAAAVGPDGLALGAQGSGFAQFIAVTPLEDGRVRLHLRAEQGNRYEVQRSRDLLHWSVVTTVIAEERAIEITDTSAEESSFYRAFLTR